MILNRKEDYFIQWLIGIGDLILLNFLFSFVYSRFHIESIRGGIPNLREVVLLLNFCYFFSLYFCPIQLHVPVLFIDKVVQRSFRLVTVLMLVFVACLLFLRLVDLLSVLWIYYVIIVAAFSFWHVLGRLFLKLYRKKGYNVRMVIIVGAGKNGLELCQLMRNDLSYGFKVIGFFDDNVSIKNTLPDYLGTTEDVEDFVLNHVVDEIYCTLPNAHDTKIKRILNFSEKQMIRFYIVPEFYRNVKKSMILEIMETIPVLSIRREPLQSFYNRFWKRTFDVLFSILILLTIYPILYLVIGFLIKLTSPGPILFRQKRSGLYNKEFECLKFRTMRMNMEADHQQAVKDDQRNTSIGGFLRRTSLDEFPQFVNVLLGDMSVVGPRPHMLNHTGHYSTLVDKYMVRHLVRPGLTGWAQVTGFRGETKTLDQMEERVRRDVWYIENWTFFLDFKIIIVTFFAIFRGNKEVY